MSDVTSIADACAEMERVERAERERRYPSRVYRSLRRAIDQACEEVELVNLAAGGGCPRGVAALIERLQLLAGEAVQLPETSAEAHKALFDLASAVLGLPHGLAPGGRAA